MQYVCDAWNKVKSWWSPKEQACLLEPLNPRVAIMDDPPTLKELEKELSYKTTPGLEKVIYFYRPDKDKMP